jgi:hypothetical protein
MWGGFCDRVQAGLFCWYSGTQRQGMFIDPLFTCGAFLPDSALAPMSLNPGFCDPQIGSQPGQALTLEQCDPAAYRDCSCRAGGHLPVPPVLGLLTGLLWVRCGSR